MAVSDVQFAFRIPDVNLVDVEATRRKVLDVINDESFKTVCENLTVLSGHAAAGPAPRGGEAEVKCEVNPRGETVCSGSVKVSW